MSDGEVGVGERLEVTREGLGEDQQKSVRSTACTKGRNRCNLFGASKRARVKCRRA